MVIQPFSFTRMPRIIFGAGTLGRLSEIIGQFGTTAVIITGKKSLAATGSLETVLDALKKNKINAFHYALSGEPSPDYVDTIASELSHTKIDVVVAIGGGSPIDAGKAVSAMLGKGESVTQYLEGIGNKIHDGSKVPFIAVPTTAGTGSEATSNAVLSSVGTAGYKRSLRHDNLIPDIAVIDPMLAISCPSHITAACGMDAFTQLLESFLSPLSSPITDDLAISGIRRIKDNLLSVCSDGAQDVNARAEMAYASFLSGVTLTHAGLGVVHGFASPIGGFFNIPHGVVCGTLVGAATAMNIRKLKESNGPALAKYLEIANIFTKDNSSQPEENLAHFINILNQWIESLKLPRLGTFGIQLSDIDKIVDKTGIKNNPVKLDRSEIKQILLERL